MKNTKSKSMTLTAILLTILTLAGACSDGGYWADEISAEPYPDTAGSEYFQDSSEFWEDETGSYAPSPEMDLTNAGESYLTIKENEAIHTEQESTLTFSLKVDTAAYTNVMRYIDSGNLPPRDAVRTEELINYFTYDNPMSFTKDSPFALDVEVGPSPFNSERHLAYIRVKTKDIDKSELPASNLTFLIDTSGSMSSHDRLPLLKESFALLVDTLTEDDRVSMVTYAGSSQVLLDGVSGADKDRILSALFELEAGGSTAGGKGIQTAYSLAEKNFIDNANNRIILATDGDFNVGVSSNHELAELVGEKRGNGIYLSVLGYGMGNIRDDLMETLSKEGNGNYFYINNLASARKALVEELASNLYTIADDVKAQVEFNPLNVSNYRLIGYENRRLTNRDFNDDTKDAGEIGIGTDVIMMFELELNRTSLDNGYRYPGNNKAEPDYADELFDVRIRYKVPGDTVSKLITHQVFFEDIVSKGSRDFMFASSVAAFAHLLRNSEYSQDLTVNDVLALAENGIGLDSAGYRIGFLRMVEKYKTLI